MWRKKNKKKKMKWKKKVSNRWKDRWVRDWTNAGNSSSDSSSSTPPISNSHHMATWTKNGIFKLKAFTTKPDYTITKPPTFIWEWNLSLIMIKYQVSSHLSISVSPTQTPCPHDHKFERGMIRQTVSYLHQLSKRDSMMSFLSKHSKYSGNIRAWSKSPGE